MSRINRFSRRTPYEGSLYEYPVELLASTMDIAQKRYDQNKEIANTIQDFVIPSLPQDRALANELQTKYAGEVDAIIKDYSGDYSKASKRLEELTRKIKKDFNPGGVANAISGNYNNYKDWLKNSQDLIEKGKVLGEDLNIANAYYMNDYKGIGQFDPVRGSYNVFTPETLTEYVNPDTIIQDVYKNFKPEKIKVGRTVFQNGIQTYVEEEQEGISQERLYPSFLNAVASDPKYMNYLHQRAKFSGIAPDALKGYVDNYTKQRAQDLSYMNKSDIQKAERDPLFLLREKKRLDKETFSELFSPYQYEPTIEAPAAKPADLKEDWRSIFGKKEIVQTPQGSMPGMDYSKTKYDNKNLIDVLFSQEFIDKTHINSELAKAVWKDVIAKDPSAYGKNYGKNKAWTEEFERSFIKTYKGTEANFSRQQPYSIKISDLGAQENILNELAGRLRNPESVNVALVGTNIEKSAASAGISAEDIIDTKTGKLRPNTVSIAIGGPGYATAGYQVHTDKGTFLFIDNTVRNSQYAQELRGAMNPLFFDGLSSSNSPIRRVNPRTGKVEWGTLTKKIRKVVDGQYGEDLYFNPIKDIEGNDVDRTPQQTSTVEILDQYAPKFQAMLGAGATKSNQTLKSFFYLLNNYGGQ